ncbi:hypothetical protein LCGC14_2242830 [marine sediment metagenome]|uniref:Uncharacterized protein n=1 Tax=marine sediment metagenome TaxID=412755 RepID=A0A0F9D4L1_9ZZZZ
MEPLNEQNFITNVVKKIFSAIINDRNQSLNRAMQKDPRYQKILADVKKSRRELHALVVDELKRNPKLAAKYRLVKGL